MDVSRLKKNDLKVWLPMMDGVDVECRYIGQREFDRLSAAATDKRLDSKRHRYVEERDEKKFRSSLARAVVCSWRGITEDEAPFPCTPENIDYLMEESTEFRLLVMDAPLNLEKMLAAEKDEQEKNSSTTSVPGPTSLA